MSRPDLIDVVPLTATNVRGVTIILERANYDTWLATRGPQLVAEGYVRLVVTAHVPYEDRQHGGRR